jgi:hypothetical protein
MTMARLLILLAAAAYQPHPCYTFHAPATNRFAIKSSLYMSNADQPTEGLDNLPLDPKVASAFTIRVCTSTNCSKRLQNLGLDQYHVLGEIYARAQDRNVEECMIIEDGGCQGGKNCKMGPCVGVLHEEFDGNVALEGMNGNEFRERV